MLKFWSNFEERDDQENLTFSFSGDILHHKIKDQATCSNASYWPQDIRAIRIPREKKSCLGWREHFFLYYSLHIQYTADFWKRKSMVPRLITNNFLKYRMFLHMTMDSMNWGVFNMYSINSKLIQYYMQNIHFSEIRNVLQKKKLFSVCGGWWALYRLAGRFTEIVNVIANRDWNGELVGIVYSFL